MTTSPPQSPCPPSQPFSAPATQPKVRARIMELMLDHDGASTIGDTGLDDTLDQMRTEIRRFRR